MTIFLIAVILWITLFGRQKTATMRAIKELRNGTLKVYSEQIYERIKLYEDEELKDIVVNELTVF